MTKYSEEFIDVQLEIDGLLIDAQVRLDIETDGDHPFGTSRITGEIEEIICYGNDGEEVKYSGEYDKELIELAKEKLL